jgi:hypothetical protein
MNRYLGRPGAPMLGDDELELPGSVIELEEDEEDEEEDEDDDELDDPTLMVGLRTWPWLDCAVTSPWVAQL